MSSAYIEWMSVLTVVTTASFGIAIHGEEPVKPVKRTEELAAPPYHPGESAPPARNYRDTPERRLMLAHQWLYLGINGELIAPSDHVQDAIEPVLVFKEKDKLQLKMYFGIRDLRTVAIVDADGYVNIDKEAVKEITGKHLYVTPGLPEFPGRWPLIGGSKMHMMPSQKSILFKTRAEEFKRTFVPQNSLGWVLLSSYSGYIIFPVEGAEQPENVVWIIPHDPSRGAKGGFDFVHSGPIHTGVFMRVAESGEITLETGALNVENYTDKKNYWPYYEVDTGSLTVDLDGHVLRALGYSSKTRFRYKNHQIVSEVLDITVY